VVYLPAVLLVATLWGLPPGLYTAILSAAAFNFFHIPPTGRFTIADPRNWVALAAFMVVAIVAGAIAEIARARSAEAEMRREEADLAAELAREMLGETDTPQALATAARRVAGALGLASAAIDMAPALPALDHGPRLRRLPLRDASGADVATLVVPARLTPELTARLHERVVPTLAALISIALRRDAIQAETVRTEALRRSDEVKTALLRSVSHDLRTPLTAIVTAGHALTSGTLTSEDRRELADVVVSEGERLATLVEKLLDLSRLQGGAASPHREWLAPEDVVLSAYEGLALGHPEIRIALPPDLPEIRADAAQLERAFANLLENACRYGAGAPVAVTGAQAGGRVVINVVDQGPGIPAGELDRIFEPFYRGTETDSQRFPGSGLGLAIARGFVEAGGGTLDATSLPGQGTTFTVSLPIDQ
jgi:two-component system sensor histidine kinase KdpD